MCDYRYLIIICYFECNTILSCGWLIFLVFTVVFTDFELKIISLSSYGIHHSVFPKNRLDSAIFHIDY